ncbi:MAG: ribosome maturation factor RimM [Rikenellaceae bacterium]
METVARVNRLFGTGGEVMITLYPTYPEDFNKFEEPLFAKIDGLNVPLYFEKFERRGRAGAVVSFADIDTERRVTELLNIELYMAEAEEDMSEGSVEDEFTMDDLVGYSVEATCGDGDIVYGELTAFYDNPNNPLFGVMIDQKEVLIPAAEEFIAGIDFERERIIFILPEGLLEL